MSRILIILVVMAAAQSAVAQDTKENADFKLAVSLYNDKFYDLALEQFRQFVSTYPNTPQGAEARFYLGLCQLQLKQFEEARFTFQNFALAYPEHPKAPDAWWNVADAYRSLGNDREAALAYERVKTFHPRSKLAPAALLEASTYFERTGDRENAKKVLRALAQEFASADVVPEGRLRLARLYYAERQYELARGEARKAAEASKDERLVSGALQLVADCQAQLGRFEDAKSTLSEILSRFRTGPPYAEAMLALGRLQRSTGEMEEALKSWKAVADSKSSPSSVREIVLLEIGDALWARGQSKEALDAYEAAIAVKGRRQDEALYKAGRCAERLGQAAKAGDLYARAAADTSRTFDRRMILVGAIQGARLQKKYHQAIRFAEEFRETFPADRSLPRVLLEAATIADEGLGDPRRAIEFYDAVAGVGESAYSDDALLGKARALRKAGALNDALGALDQLEKQFPVSDLLPLARDERFAILTYEQRNYEGGIKNLALLIGDVIAGKPAGELAFRLAEISFNDLRDYENAALQYQTALKAGLDRPAMIRAMFRRAQALEFMARSSRAPEYLSAAIAAYDSFLTRFSAVKEAQEAFLSRMKLELEKTGNASELRKIASAFRKNSHQTQARDRVWLALGEAFQRVKSHQDAASVFGEILRGKPDADVEAHVLIGLAKAKFELGAKDTGATLLQTYLQKFPSHELSAMARSLLARFRGERGEVDRALRLYQELDQSAFYSVYAQGLDASRADAYYRAGDLANAQILYQAALAEFSGDPFPLSDPPVRLLLNLSDCYYRTGNRTAARRMYADVLARDTSSAIRSQVYASLASIAQEEKNLELAARYLQEASRYGGGTPEQRLEAAIRSADLFFRSEDYKTAVARFAELLPQAKNDSLRQFLESRLIVGYYRLDNLAEADKRATAFVKSYPKARDVAAKFEFERGLYHLRRDEADLAIRRFENVRQRFPKSGTVAEAVYWLARALEMKGQTQRAVQLYDSLLQHFPNDPMAPRVQLSLGNAYYTLERWDDAAKQYKTIVDRPDRAPDLVQYAMSNLIMAYKEIGLFDAALQLTRQYIDRFPEDPDLISKRIDIGVLYQKLGYYDQSILHLTNLLESSPPDVEGELRYYIGEAYFYKGDYQQAILEFLKVPYLITRQSPIDWAATSYYMAGQSYEKMSRFDQAITMYRQIIERPGIDVTFKTAAQKEIDRVNALVKGR